MHSTIYAVAMYQSFCLSVTLVYLLKQLNPSSSL